MGRHLQDMRLHSEITSCTSCKTPELLGHCIYHCIFQKLLHGSGAAWYQKISTLQKAASSGQTHLCTHLCKHCKLIALHTPLQELQTTFLNCTETHHCKVSTCTLAPLLLLHLELRRELQPASLAAAKPPNYTALQLFSKLQTSCMKTSAANTASANCIAWPQPGLHLCTRGLPSHSTNRLQRSCICFFVRPLHAVSLQWLQRFHLCTCTSGWKRHRLHLHCLHPIFTGFPIEIQYTAIVFNRAQRAPVEVFSMHPAFSNGFLIEIQYTAIVFNRAQRAPVEVFSMHPAFSNGFLIEIQYTAIVF